MSATRHARGSPSTTPHSGCRSDDVVSRCSFRTSSHRASGSRERRSPSPCLRRTSRVFCPMAPSRQSTARPSPVAPRVLMYGNITCVRWPVRTSRSATFGDTFVSKKILTQNPTTPPTAGLPRRKTDHWGDSVLEAVFGGAGPSFANALSAALACSPSGATRRYSP